MLTELLQSTYFALFVIIALGFLLGRVKIKGLSLDISAVIFVALAFGHFGVVIPKEFGDLGLVLFIFTIGIQAGPGFFSSFKSKGKVLIVLTAIIIGSASLTAVAMKYIFHLDAPSTVGLLAGALTSTPGLAVAIDSTGSSLASIAYGIAYPFGVIGVILFVKLLPKIFRVDLNKEAARLEKERTGQYPELGTCIFKVTNKMVFGRTLAQLSIRAVTGAVISRIKSGDSILMPHAGYVVKEGDILQAVGTEDALSQLSMLLGERSSGELPLTKQQSVESILVSRKDMVGKSLGSLNLQQNFGCTITRVRRSGIDITPSPELSLKFGDKLTVVGETEGITGVSNLFGNNAKVLSDTDFLPIALGIVLGVLVGKLNITCFKAGSTIYSGRVYADVDKGWKYGYIEARIMLPEGKGTWPAFWMMPVDNDFTANPWPHCGEIDIMESVGYDPNVVVSTIHCTKYNNTGTAIESARKKVPTAQDEFHVYAMEWTADKMTFLVDGEPLLTYANDGTGEDAWPFDKPFYVILNLAWGGAWGGQQGVDESCLPAVMKVDYVRVFQK